MLLLLCRGNGSRFDSISMIFVVVHSAMFVTALVHAVVAVVVVVVVVVVVAGVAT